MTTDLHELFDRAGHEAPHPSFDTDLVVRRGRQLRARRRSVRGAGTMLLTGVLALGAVAATGSLPGAGHGTASVSPVSALALLPEGDAPAPPSSSWGNPPAALADVTVPDPAPGFPVRRDEDWTGHMQDDHGHAYWVNTYLLADRSQTDHVTMVVGYTPRAVVQPDGTIAGHPVVGSPRVAGVVGQVTRFEEKGVPVTTLYFNAGDMNVMVSGVGKVSIGQLVDLGNAVGGLG